MDLQAALLAQVHGTAQVLARWDPPRIAGALTTIETARAAAFHHRADADDFVAAHLLVRELAAYALGTDPDGIVLVSRCAGCGSDQHGAPSVAGFPRLAVSLAHGRRVVAAAVGAGPLGVDVEPVDGAVDPAGVVGVALAPAERAVVAAAADPTTAFLLLWVRKEALVKAGVASLDTFADIDLVASPTAWRGRTLSTWTGHLPGVGNVVAGVAATGEVSWNAGVVRAERRTAPDPATDPAVEPARGAAP